MDEKVNGTVSRPRPNLQESHQEEKTMLKKLTVIGLFAMSVVTMMPNEASARVCLVKNGSTCVFWSGSVECDLNATGVGNVKKDPKSLGCDIMAPGAGLIVCGNPGAKRQTSPGIQLVFVPQTFSEFEPIEPTQVDRNGNASLTVTASLTEEQLRSLDQFCPNSNWAALDYVPINMNVLAELIDEDGFSLGSASFQCTLPNPETLQWDKVTQTIERRQYDCCQEGFDCPNP